MTVDENLMWAGAGAVFTDRELMRKLLGPTCEYLGEQARDWVKKCFENLGSIIGKARLKLGQRIEDNGQVPSRVFRRVFEEGRFIEDELVAEYFGGLLASARTEDGKDDSVLPLIAEVQRLSVHQLRLHYATYAIAHQVFQGKDLGLHWFRKAVVLVPYDSVLDALGLDKASPHRFEVVQSLLGLAKEGLVGQEADFSSNFLPGRDWRSEGRDGLCLPLTIHGLSLFYAAHAFQDKPADLGLNANFELPDECPVAIPADATGFECEDLDPVRAAYKQLKSGLENGSIKAIGHLG